MASATEHELTSEDIQELEKSFAQTYGVELFFEKEPQIDKHALFEAMKKYCGHVAMADTRADSRLIMFFHVDHEVQYKDAQAPAQFVVMFPNPREKTREDYHASFQQSWNWRDAQETVEQCPYSLLATDMMASGLPYKERLQLFRNSLRALVETVPCQAIHFHLTQQFVSPEQYVESFEGEEKGELYGTINVRLFHLEGSDDMIMDTLGFAAIGLPDLQCHFRELEPDAIAHMFYNTAYYIYEHGDVIEDGHTIQGIQPSDKWTCYHEISLVDPKREVLDINPGFPYAGGNRK